MKIPEGMTVDQVIDQIEIVVNRIAPRYVFPGFTFEDIKQESFIICMKALERYDPNYPLENFLSSNLSNRLKNLIRDKHFSKGDNENKKRVTMPGQLSNEESTCYYMYDSYDAMDLRDLVDIVDTNLPYHYRADYLKMINGVPVPKKQKDELVKVIKNIAQEAGYIE